jgi:catechol-2,3-dioxygenase
MKLGHVALTASDPGLVADFYQRFLGLHRLAEVVTEETGPMVLLSTGTARAPELLVMSNPEGMHVAFKVDTLGELRELYRVAPEQGARILFSFDHGSTFSFYVRDPAGNACEVYWETGRRPSGGNRPIDLSKSEEELLELTPS